MLTRRDETRQADKQTLLLNKGLIPFILLSSLPPLLPWLPFHPFSADAVHQPCTPNQAKASYPTNHPINQPNRAIPFRWGFTKYGPSEL
jgi:hypothetical protein